jgi:uncharacterized protein YgiM (DUF1202 family)
MNRLWILFILPLFLACSLSAGVDSQNEFYSLKVAPSASVGQTAIGIQDPAQPTNSQIVTVIAEEALNLRVSHGIHSRILAQLPAGAKLYVVGDCTWDDGYWVNVITTDRVGGWVNVEFISGDICK